MGKQGFVYILASRRNGTLYIGVTSNLIHRIWQHKEDLVEGFTKRYHVKMLVWYEGCDDIAGAILREKQCFSIGSRTCNLRTDRFRRMTSGGFRLLPE